MSNVSPNIKPIRLTASSDLEKTATWCTVGLCAIFMLCFLAWCAQFAPEVWAFLKTMASLA